MRRFLEFLLSSFEELIVLRFIAIALTIGIGIGTGVLSVAAAVLAGGEFPGSIDPGDVVFLKIIFYPLMAWLAFGAYRILLQPEESDIWSWAALLAAPALRLALRTAYLLGGQWLPQGCLWAALLILLGMEGTGLWLVRAWRMNQWAAELQELAAENALRRAQREMEGAESVEDL